MELVGSVIVLLLHSGVRIKEEKGCSVSSHKSSIFNGQHMQQRLKREKQSLSRKHRNFVTQGWMMLRWRKKFEEEWKSRVSKRKRH